MEKNFEERLEECSGFSDIFELVKDAAEKTIGRARAGLMLGITELGQYSNGFIGAYHELDSNLIVMNATLLRRIKETSPKLFKSYCFHVLLHEYIHSLGFVDEQETRELTKKISRRLLGKNHPATGIATNIEKFLPGLLYSGMNLLPQKEPEIFIVQGFDKGNLTYDFAEQNAITFKWVMNALQAKSCFQSFVGALRMPMALAMGRLHKLII